MTTSIDTAQLRKAFSCFATGVTVITTRWQDQDWAMTCNSFGSVSLNPPMVLWSIRREASSHEAFTRSAGFSVNVLNGEQAALALQCASGPMAQRLSALSSERTPQGHLRVDGALALFDCRLTQTVPVGDHDLVLGEVVHLEQRDGPALLYWRSQFAAHAGEPVVMGA